MAKDEKLSNENWDVYTDLEEAMGILKEKVESRPLKKRGRPKKKTEAENKLEQLVAKSADKETLPKQELVKQEALEVDVIDTESLFGVLDKDDKPLSDIEMAVAIASGEGKYKDEEICSQFGITIRKLRSIENNPSVKKVRQRLVNDRVEMMRATSTSLLKAGLDQYTQEILDDLNSDDILRRALAKAQLFGRDSYLDIASKLEKLKSVEEDEKGDDFKDFMAGLLIGRGNG